VDVGGGVRLSIEQSGPIGGPPLVLTHGYGGTLRMWDPQVPALVAAGWRASAWDLRGHGKSTGPADPSRYTLEHCLDDLAAVAAATGPGPAVLVGHSFGGYLSLACWCRQRDRVRALVLVDTGPGYRDVAARAGWNTTVERFTGSIARKGRLALGRDDGMGYDRHRDFEVLALAGRGYLRQHDSRVIDALGRVDVPTLILVGSKDRPFLAPSKMMAEKIPGARLEVVEEAGHAANLHQPEVVNAAIASFLAGLGR
jgi:pimeloyl-ACP methyl ester carboxylesterase